MSVVGFNFTQIKGERKDKGQGKIQIKNNISVKNVKAEDLTLSSADKEGIRVSFEFATEYTPDIGNILLTADVLLLEEAEQKTKIMDSWNANKNIPGDMAEPIFNLVLKKFNLKALNVAEDLRLPSPIQLGKVKVKEEAAEK